MRDRRGRDAAGRRRRAPAPRREGRRRTPRPAPRRVGRSRARAAPAARRRLPPARWSRLRRA